MTPQAALSESRLLALRNSAETRLRQMAGEKDIEFHKKARNE